jgi:hypothetical protein
VDEGAISFERIVHWLLIGSVTRDKLNAVRAYFAVSLSAEATLLFRKGLGWHGNDNGECIPTQAIIEELAIHAIHNASYLFTSVFGHLNERYR